MNHSHPSPPPLESGFLFPGFTAGVICELLPRTEEPPAENEEGDCPTPGDWKLDFLLLAFSLAEVLAAGRLPLVLAAAESGDPVLKLEDV